MNVKEEVRRSALHARRLFASIFGASILGVAVFCAAAGAQETGKPQEPGPVPKMQEAPPANPDAAIAGEQDLPPGKLPANFTQAQRADRAWTMLTEAAGDARHSQTRIQALAALGMLRTARSTSLIKTAMQDQDLDVRTAAALAAAQSRDRDLATPLRKLLDDSEPEVAFTAATALWKMGDRSGEDILMAVADGDRSANPSLMHGARHKIDSDLHDPAKMAKLGAMQGAEILLGPFGFGIAAFNYIHQSGGDLARASAIEQLAQEHTAPVHQELLAALADKDPTVRAAAAQGLVAYRDKATSPAIYVLFIDPKNPVRLTAAAAYLRTTGTPGPVATAPVKSARPKR